MAVQRPLGFLPVGLGAFVAGLVVVAVLVLALMGRMEPTTAVCIGALGVARLLP